MATQNILVGSVDNNGGVVLKGGNTNNTQNYTDMLSLSGNYSLDGDPVVSVPVQTSDVTRALGGNYVFAFNSDRPLIKGVTRIINTVDIDHDLSTTGTSANYLRAGIHPRVHNVNRLDTKAMRMGKFSMITGKFAAGYPTVSIDNFGDDFAASVSRSNPGSFRFVVGLVPVRKQYASKTG